MSAQASSLQGSGGLSITQKMLELLQQPGYISYAKGGGRLREIYRHQSSTFNANLLSNFGLQCYLGNPEGVINALASGIALNGTETPFKFGYATLVVAGAQRVIVGPADSLRHVEVLKILLSRGMPPDVEDIAGLTALHHATMHLSQPELARLLLQSGASPNHQNRYGEVPLFAAFQTNQPACVDLLMEFGADLDIKEADGLTPRTHFLQCGPEVTAAVTKWIRRRSGEEALMDEKKCGGCEKKGEGVKLLFCAKCRVVRYCSTECQRSHWKVHKKACQPFSESNTVTFKPAYDEFGGAVPMGTANFVRNAMGIPTAPPPNSHRRGAHAPKSFARGSKSIVIKVQVPFPVDPRSHGNLLVYTKKRDFMCCIRRMDNPAGYDRISQIILTRGVGGAKAYFAAELMSKEELVVKVSQVLAEQPF